MGILFNVLIGIVAGLGVFAFFLLIGIKLGYRVMALFGKAGPCPVAPFLWKVTLEVPQRVAMVPSMLEWMGIQPGERVLEIGTGPGVFSLPVARKIGPGGQLTSLDIQQGFIDEVRHRVQEAGLKNVTTVVADAQRLPLPAASFDRVLLIDVLPEVPDQAQVLREVFRVLAPGGKLNITGEFFDPDYQFSFEVERLVTSTGLFSLVVKRGNWWRYVLTFQKQSVRAALVDVRDKEQVYQ